MIMIMGLYALDSVQQQHDLGAVVYHMVVQVLSRPSLMEALLSGP